MHPAVRARPCGPFPVSRAVIPAPSSPRRRARAAIPAPPRLPVARVTTWMPHGPAPGLRRPRHKPPLARVRQDRLKRRRQRTL